MGDTELEVFSARLKELRTSLNLTQSEFASKIGSTASALSSYEKKLKNPSVIVAKRIAEHYNVSIDWLCGLSNRKSIEFKIDSCSDLIKMLIRIDERFLINPNIINNYPSIVFLDSPMDEFFKEWIKMRNLLKESVLDIDVYNLWIEKTLSKYKQKVLDSAGVIEGAFQEDKDHDDAIMDNEDEWK